MSLKKKRISDNNHAHIPQQSETTIGTYQYLSNFEYPNDLDSQFDLETHKLELEVSFMNDAPVLLDKYRKVSQALLRLIPSARINWNTGIRGLDVFWDNGTRYISSDIIHHGDIVRDTIRSDPPETFISDYQSDFYDSSEWAATQPGPINSNHPAGELGPGSVTSADYSKHSELIDRTRGLLPYHVDTDGQDKFFMYDALHLRKPSVRIHPFTSIEMHRRDTVASINIPIHPFYKIDSPYITANDPMSDTEYPPTTNIPWRPSGNDPNLRTTSIGSDAYISVRPKTAKKYLDDDNDRLYKPIFTDNNTVLKIYSMINKYYIKYKDDEQKKIPRPILNVACHAESIRNETRQAITTEGRVSRHDDPKTNSRVIKLHKVTTPDQNTQNTCTVQVCTGCSELFSHFNISGEQIISQDRDPRYTRSDMILAQSKSSIPVYYNKDELMTEHHDAILHTRNCEFTILYKRRRDEECDEIPDGEVGDYLQYGSGIVTTKADNTYENNEKVLAMHPNLQMYVKGNISFPIDYIPNPHDQIISYNVIWDYTDIIGYPTMNDLIMEPTSDVTNIDGAKYPDDSNVEKKYILSMNEDDLDFTDYNRNLKIMRMFGLTTQHPHVDKYVDSVGFADGVENPYATTQFKKIKNKEYMKLVIDCDDSRFAKIISGIWNYTENNSGYSTWEKDNLTVDDIYYTDFEIYNDDSGSPHEYMLAYEKDDDMVII